MNLALVMWNLDAAIFQEEVIARRNAERNFSSGKKPPMHLLQRKHFDCQNQEKLLWGCMSFRPPLQCMGECGFLRTRVSLLQVLCLSPKGKSPKISVCYKQSIENGNSTRIKTYRLRCYPIYFIQQTPQPQKSIFSSTSFLHNCFQTFHAWLSRSN